MARRGPLVGRQQEIDKLYRYIERAEQGHGAIVLIGGDAGIGKTALVAEALAEAADRGVLTAVGRCAGAGETPPFGPWVELMGALAAGARAATTARAAAGATPVAAGPDAAALPFPFGTAPTTPGLPELAVAITDRLGAQPLVAVLEDLQWTDPDSLALLKSALPYLQRLPILLIATYRSDELERAHPLRNMLPELQRSGAVRMTLDPLTQQDVTEMVNADLSGAPQAVPLSRSLYERTAGHPLFLTELLDPFWRKGLLGGRQYSLPETLQQAIDRRFARLNPPAQAALHAAAVVGATFSVDVVQQVAEVPPDVLRAGLREAVALDMIRQDGPDGEQYSFTQPVYREALADAAGGARRGRLHLRAAEALMAAPHSDAHAVALHLSRAGDSRAPGALLPAGDQALRAGALVHAAELYEQGLDLLPDGDSRRAELLLKLGHTLSEVDFAHAHVCWAEAVRAADGAGDRIVAMWAWHLLTLHGVRSPDRTWQEPAAWVHSEQEALQHSDRSQQIEADLFGRVAGYPRIATERVHVLLATGHLSEAEDLLRRTMAGSQPGADITEFQKINFQMAACAGRTAEALSLCPVIVGGLLRRHDYRKAADWSLGHLRMLLRARADDPDEMDACAGRVAHLESRVGTLGGGAVRAGLSGLGFYHFLRGDWSKLRESLLPHIAQNPTAPATDARLDAARLQLALGDLAGMRASLAPLAPRFPDEDVLTFGVDTVAAHLLRARYHLAMGDADQARVWLEGASRWVERRRLISDKGRLRVAWAQFYLRGADPSQAKAEAWEASVLAGGQNDCLTLIGAHRLLAACSRAAQAEDHFDAALNLAERCRFPYEGALVRLERAKQMPHWSGAAEDLRLARETFARLGALPALREAEQSGGTIT